MGLKAPVVKTHGSADALAVENTIAQIHTMIESKVIEKRSPTLVRSNLRKT